MSDTKFFGEKDLYATGQVTVSTAAVGLPTTTVNNAQTYATFQTAKDLKCSAIMLECNAQPAYITFDGTTPSATNGMLLAANDTMWVAGHQRIKDMLMIRQGASDATVNVFYYKAGGRIPGSDAFRLYDTYGLALDFTEELARDRGLTVDRDGFESDLAAQQEDRARLGVAGAAKMVERFNWRTIALNRLRDFSRATGLGQPA